MICLLRRYQTHIFEVVKHINALKARGLDGIQAIFYHKNWNIIGKFICNMDQSFFNHRQIKEVNRTYIILISKISNP